MDNHDIPEGRAGDHSIDDELRSRLEDLAREDAPARMMDLAKELQRLLRTRHR